MQLGEKNCQKQCELHENIKETKYITKKIFQADR